jgi:hypothetical protein
MTTTVKNQNEFWLYYTFREVGMIGTLSIEDSINAGDYEDAIPALSNENSQALSDSNYGDYLYLKVEARAIENTDFIVEVKGTDNATTPNDITKEVTIPKRTQVDQLIIVPEPDIQKWKSITSVLVKTGESPTEGVELKLIILPQNTDFTTIGKGGLINFDNGFGWNKGSTSRAIPNKYNPVDHYKRQRGENSLNVTQFYTTFGQSLQYLRDRTFTLKAEVHEDGRADVAERYYFTKVRLNVPVSGGGDGADLSQDSDGSFSEMIVL